MKWRNKLIVIVFLFAIVILSGCIDDNMKDGPAATTTAPETTTTTATISTTSTLPTATTSIPAITITFPIEGDEVSWREIVEGTSKGVYGSELNIYVLVYPIDAGGPWWVQPNVNVFPDGNWEVNCYFGRDPKSYPEDKGAHFRVSAIITTEKLREGQQLQKLPDRVAEDEVRVIRG